jgi:hypothetical protein
VIATAAYSLQLGLNRQRWPRKGLTHRRYAAITRSASQPIDLLMAAITDPIA